MRGGVIRPFQVVGIPSFPLGDKMFHERLQVGAGGGIPIFTEHQRGACVRQKEITHPFLHVPIAQLGSHNFGYIMQPFAMG